MFCLFEIVVCEIVIILVGIDFGQVMGKGVILVKKGRKEILEM